VTSGGRLAGIDVADNDDVDVSLVLPTHGDGIESCLVVFGKCKIARQDCFRI
jgi:hypothetical protein